jgi:hypothetical protein
MSSPASRERLGLLLGFIGMVIFGGTLPATRLAVSQIDPIALTSLRTAIAGLCSLVLLVALRRPLPPRALWPQLALTMLCVAVLFPLLMSMGMQTVDASHGGVVLGILPIATALSPSPSPMSGRAAVLDRVRRRRFAGARFPCGKAAARSRPGICCCSPPWLYPRSATHFPADSRRRCRAGKSSVGCWLSRCHYLSLPLR